MFLHAFCFTLDTTGGGLVSAAVLPAFVGIMILR